MQGRQLTVCQKGQAGGRREARLLLTCMLLATDLPTRALAKALRPFGTEEHPVLRTTACVPCQKQGKKSGALAYELPAGEHERSR